MRDLDQDERVLEAFVTLADTLVLGYDVVELLQTLVETCQAALDVSAAAILLADESGELDLVASTSEQSTIMETMQLSAEEGPCIDAFRTARIVAVPDLDEDSSRWPAFCHSAREQGFAAVYAIPLRLRTSTIGTLNLFRVETGRFVSRDLRVAQALADVATIGIIHERALRESDLVREQLQGALNTRVEIEQAKGLLAHTHEVSMEDAFHLLRAYARRNSRPLSEVAHGLVNRTIIF